MLFPSITLLPYSRTTFIKFTVLNQVKTCCVVRNKLIRLLNLLSTRSSLTLNAGILPFTVYRFGAPLLFSFDSLLTLPAPRRRWHLPKLRPWPCARTGTITLIFINFIWHTPLLWLQFRIAPHRTAPHRPPIFQPTPLTRIRWIRSLMKYE